MYIDKSENNISNIVTFSMLFRGIPRDSIPGDNIPVGNYTTWMELLKSNYFFLHAENRERFTFNDFIFCYGHTDGFS